MSLMEERLKRYFKKGEVIFKDGDSGQSMFIVLEGQVEISKILGDQKTTLAQLGKGAIFGEMSIIDNQPRSATAMAEHNTILLEISREMFRSRLEEVPRWLQTFFGIIVERLRDATKNQSVLLTQGAGRQIVNLIALFAQQEEPDDQGRVILHWNKLVSFIAFSVGLNEELVVDLINKLEASKLGKSDRREKIGRVFILEDSEKLRLLADFCLERYMIEAGHTKEMSERFSLKDKQEVELLSVLEVIIEEQGAIDDFPVAILESRLQEKYNKPLSVYQKVIDTFSQSGILDSFHPEGSEPVFRINNRELLNEKIASIQLLVELRDLEKKIME